MKNKRAWVWSETLVENATAGPKARKDVVRFMQSRARILEYRHSTKLLEKFAYAIAHILTFAIKLNRNDELYVQYPLFIGQRWCIRLFKRLYNLRLIYVIHDLDYARGMGSKEHEMSDLQYADVIIAQTPRMSEMLAKEPKISARLVTLNLFDYWMDEVDVKNVDASENVAQNNIIKIVVAGNLARNKANYVHQLKNLEDVQFQLYGLMSPDEQQSAESKNVKYLGAFKANSPPKFSANFGLVWDGDSLDTCSGQMGKYLEINAPHKASLYLGRGMPIVVWNKSALAEFVKQNKVGVCVECLLDIKSIVIDGEEYEDMLCNANALSVQIKSGGFINSAADKAMEND